jgi:CHAT domain-containing protein
VLHAASTAYRGRYEESERALDAVAMDTLRHPALAGRSAWVRATVHLRTGRYHSSRSWARTAERHLARAGEREYAGAARAVAADAAFALGDADDVYTNARHALATLRPYRGSVWLHNALAAVSLRAAEDGMPGAALRLGWEDVRVASATGDPVHLAEAHLVRARVAMSAGRGPLARAETSAGAAVLARTAQGPVHDWLSADRQLTRAFTELGADPLRASAALDSAFGFFAALRNPLRALPLLVARGEARLASGDARGAADLERATASIAALGRGTGDGALAATLLDAARPVFDRAVALRLARHDTLGALLALERGRAAFGRTRPLASSTILAARGPAVVYGVVGDTILTWVVGRGTTRLHRQVVPREELARSTERLRWALERGNAAAADREMDRLAGWLLHPVEEWIAAPGGEVTVVADGELAWVPFAALPARSGRRWIEDRPLRRAASLADAALPRPSGRPDRALLVADPAFDPARHPGLARLPGARAEVEDAAREYARRVVLSGADATRETFFRALRSAEVVHFAGHAVWDGGSPKRSWLVMAPGADSVGRISAAELGAAGLEGVRLVVLSACHTIGSGEGRMGGFAGFAGSLLAGGADGVVGSLWRVDDHATRVLMREFHLAYRASGDPSDALRRAQLALLRSADVRLRAPSAWAGFVYAGS